MNTTKQDYRQVTNHGTIARVAIQCIDPATGQTGDFLFTGESHREQGARVSPLFGCLQSLFEWTRTAGWEPYCDHTAFRYSHSATGAGMHHPGQNASR